MTTQLHAAMQVVPGTFTPITASPTTGNTLNLTPSGATQYTLLTPSGTLAALTISLANGTIQGMLHTVLSTQAVTTLTLSGSNFSASILALPTALTANVPVTFLWNDVTSKWVRVV